MSFDSVKVTVSVNATPETAFRLFTTETDLWWRRGPKFRASGRYPGGVLSFEPAIGGKLFEMFETGSGPRVVVSGRILIWDPPTRLAFHWRAANFAETDPSTTVEVTFTPSGNGDATIVTLTHSGWAAIRPDHPVRHGLDPAGSTRMIGLWWGELLSAFRLHPPSR